MSQTPANPEMGYEQARDELIEVVRQLESGGVALADSMRLWERGEKLAGICQAWLDGAKQRIEQARIGQSPTPSEGEHIPK